MTNHVDPDQMPQSAASDLGLHCLQRPICPNTKGFPGSVEAIFSPLREHVPILQKVYFLYQGSKFW